MNRQIKELSIAHSMQMEKIIIDTLNENEIKVVNYHAIAKHLNFYQYPDGCKILHYKGKPIIYFEPLRFEQKINTDKTIISLVQDYHVIEYSFKKKREKETGKEKINNKKRPI